MTTLQKIVKEAKRLKKLHPNKFPKWTDYVKAASKTIKKTGSKKVADVNVTYRSQKDADYIVERKRDGKFKGMLRVAGTRTKKKPATHTDKGSHNVKIKVVSGVDSNKFYINLLSKIASEIQEKEAIKDLINKNYNDPKNKALRSYWASKRNAVSKTILMLKRQQNAIKKSIK